MSLSIDSIRKNEVSADHYEPSWKKELSSAIRSPVALLEQLELSHHIDSIDETANFRLLATAAYINKIQPGDIDDPLLRQILPLQIENDSVIQLSGKSDPVGDLDAQVATGLLHKYHGRALIVSTGACAIHCRYCFRRRFPYQDSAQSSSSLNQTLEYLEQHTEIDEIILSGGDPLTLDDEKLSDIITRLEAVTNIQTLRIHTRLPVILPSRIGDHLIDTLKSSRFEVVMVIHVNHANELQAMEKNKLKKLHKAGVNLLNQSVLLKGINDSEQALIDLSKRLIQCNTLPYYLHQLDPVNGAMHFKVERSHAIHLHEVMTERLPGYLVPKLVQEIAGNTAKSAIFRI
jgi:EF-P beta-lysylation protein EpmB